MEGKPTGGRPRPALSLKARALRLLARREHSRLELRRKLASHAATSDEADRVLDEYVDAYVKTGDANDILYAIEASRDYDPKPGLGRIVAPLVGKLNESL